MLGDSVGKAANGFVQSGRKWLDRQLLEASHQRQRKAVDQAVARMVAGIDVIMYRPDDELRNLARVAVEAGVDDLFTEGCSPSRSWRPWPTAAKAARPGWPPSSRPASPGSTCPPATASTITTAAGPTT